MGRVQSFISIGNPPCLSGRPPRQTSAERTWMAAWNTGTPFSRTNSWICRGKRILDKSGGKMLRCAPPRQGALAWCSSIGDLDRVAVPAKGSTEKGWSVLRPIEIMHQINHCRSSCPRTLALPNPFPARHLIPHQS